jgi:hypothetical protein
MGTDSQVPFAHRLERCHLLDAVRVEVLQLKRVLEEDSADESPSGDGEAAFMEGHEQHNEPLRGARHGLVTGNPPLHNGGEQRKLAHLNEMEELLAGHVGARLVRHHDYGFSSMLEEVALRMRKCMESRMRAWKEKVMGSKVLNPCPTHGFKGASAAPYLRRWARHVTAT